MSLLQVDWEQGLGMLQTVCGQEPPPGEPASLGTNVSFKGQRKESHTMQQNSSGRFIGGGSGG